ncbi:yeats family protein [Fistulina hepatica ATCC 64428]|uniref:Protein AF-9 homolog n=1 Tax=Fistulina hepatica ATCC 64428 TaxID=1128425 RepID=A0A0D7A815_9AGAR|nr:yeats family protein [Fistulina hepatica ATCC 64428]
MSNEKIRVRGVTIHRPIIYGNVATVLTPEEKQSAPPDHTHKWTVAVRSVASANPDVVGGADDLSYFIKRVSFKLHETYPNPTRTVEKPPFEISETGWGEFEIVIRITFVPDSGEKTQVLYHHLKLHPWTANPAQPELPPPIEEAAKLGSVHSWQYDEVVFSDPYSVFLNTLMAHPPTSMPKTRNSRRPIPFHVADPASLEASQGSGAPEFHQGMEQEEKARLEESRKILLKELDKWRKVLSEKEKELQKLQKRLQ